MFPILTYTTSTLIISLSILMTSSVILDQNHSIPIVIILIIKILSRATKHWILLLTSLRNIIGDIKLGHFFYVVATKVIVLKIIYGGLFFALIYKGWNFVLWFIHYLKKKEHYHEYIDDHHFGHGQYDHGNFDQSPVDHGHYSQFDSFDHQPYGYDKHGYGSDYKKRVYDADGSYAVKRE